MTTLEVTTTLHDYFLDELDKSEPFNDDHFNNDEPIKIYNYNTAFIKQLYELFKNNIVEESTDPIYLRFCGLYYCVKKQYQKMKEIYLKSYTYNNTILYFHKYNIIPDWIFELNKLTDLVFMNCELTKIPDSINKW